MSEVTVPSCDEIDELVTRYAYGSRQSREERSQVEEHLKNCVPCSELVFFVQKTMALARKEPIRFEPPTEPCLTTDTFIALDEGTLDEETGRKAKLHLLACPHCREVFLMLRSLSERQVQERILEYLDAPRITEVVFRIAEKVRGALKTVRAKVIELVNISGAGHVLQPAAGAILGESAESSRSITIEDMVSDDETEEVSSLRVVVAIDREKATATLQLECSPPQRGWAVSLAAPDGNKLMSAPLVAKETILGSDLADPWYMVTVHKGEKALACFTLELRSA